MASQGSCQNFLLAVCAQEFLVLSVLHSSCLGSHLVSVVVGPTHRLFQLRQSLEKLEEIQEKAVANPSVKSFQDAQDQLESVDGVKDMQSVDKLLKMINVATIDPKEAKKFRKSQRVMCYAMFDFMNTNKDVKAENQDWGLILKLVAIFRSNITI